MEQNWKEKSSSRISKGNRMKKAWDCFWARTTKSVDESLAVVKGMLA